MDGCLTVVLSIKRAETWGIDNNKKEIIERASKRYLAGESLKDIARTYNMDYTNLWSILTKKSGTDWPCRFKYGNVDEVVIMTIPRLLDDETISTIRKMSTAKKTYTHGQIKNKYLLSRMIFCSKCGYALFGSTDRAGNQYYRHARYIDKSCMVRKFVKAPEIENSVLIHLVSTLGDVERINNAIKQATPDMSKIEGLEKEKIDLTGELKRLYHRKKR